MTASIRLRRLALGIGLLLTFGLLYALFVHFTGLAVPCLFREITGLECPGCGVTRMCISLLRLDIFAAWRANSVLLLSLPVFVTLFVRFALRYVKTGSVKSTKAEGIVCWILIAIFLVWGVLRNLHL